MRGVLIRALAGLMGATLLWMVWLANVGPLDECTAAGCFSTLTVDTGMALVEGATY